MWKKTFDLTRGEETLMELFWNAGRALTSEELYEMSEKTNLKHLHRRLRALQRKEMLEPGGAVKQEKKLVRTYLPTMTRGEYTSYVMARLGFGEKTLFSKFSAGRNKGRDGKEANDNTELIKQLEEIVAQIQDN